MNRLPWLRVDGSHLVDEGGARVRLRGFGTGGWMNMEDFITGFPSNESTMRQRLRAAMKPDAYDAFFETFDASFLGSADAAHLATLGVNSIRIPINYRHFEHDDRPFELVEEGFRRLDRVIDVFAERGIYSIIDLHAVPGAQNHHWHSDNATHRATFWEHRHFQDRVVHLWEAFADRYRDRSEVAGYNPINEPADESGAVLPAFYRRLETAVRAIDRRHILFLDGNRYSTDFSCFDEPFDNSVYACHDYALPGLVSATEYPGVTRGEYCDRGTVEQAFLRRSEFQRRTGTPIWVGEFGPQYPVGRPVDDWRYQVLRDQLEIYDAHEASWALWTYKDVGLQGLVYANPASQYMHLVAPIIDAKRRLGTDSWGGSDAGIRDILDPIDATFEHEFPDYEPYPWGRRQHIHRLVRHILLAEPLADEYAKLFVGVSVDEARELAASFHFDQCVQRDELYATLRPFLR